MNKLIVMLFATSLFACAGAKTSPDALADPVDMNGPTAEQIAAAPCGNADWSKLPPGSDVPVGESSSQEPAAPTDDSQPE